MTIPTAHEQKSFRQKRLAHRHKGGVTKVEKAKKPEEMIPKQNDTTLSQFDLTH
jgi:hypothetical protein